MTWIRTGFRRVHGDQSDDRCFEKGQQIATISFCYDLFNIWNPHRLRKLLINRYWKLMRNPDGVSRISSRWSYVNHKLMEIMDQWLSLIVPATLLMTAQRVVGISVRSHLLNLLSDCVTSQEAQTIMSRKCTDISHTSTTSCLHIRTSRQCHISIAPVIHDTMIEKLSTN